MTALPLNLIRPSEAIARLNKLGGLVIVTRTNLEMYSSFFSGERT